MPHHKMLEQTGVAIIRAGSSLGFRRELAAIDNAEFTFEPAHEAITDAVPAEELSP